jgi:hypothetical protein
MGLHLINDKPKFRAAALREPPKNGYILLSAEVEPPAGRRPMPSTSPAKAALLNRIGRHATALERHNAIRRATVFQTLLAPPASGFAQSAPRPARYDVIALVETTTTDVIGEVEATEPFKHLVEELEATSNRVDFMRARAAKYINDVDATQPGVFLFNYFVGPDVDVALELWEHLAGWYMTETGLDNSTVLEPMTGSDYLFVNHARWNKSLARLMAEQVAKPSFFTFVRANLNANQTGVMPVLCRPVRGETTF